jgi:hypothetical protein
LRTHPERIRAYPDSLQSTLQHWGRNEHGAQNTADNGLFAGELIIVLFVMGLMKFLLESELVRWLFLFGLMEDYGLLLLDQRLRINCCSLSVCFVNVGFLRLFGDWMK